MTLHGGQAGVVRSRQSVGDDDLFPFNTEGPAERLTVRSGPGRLVEARALADLHSSQNKHGCSNPPVTVHLIVRVLRTWAKPAVAPSVATGFGSTVIDRLTGGLSKDIFKVLSTRIFK
ncbi:hypothetical protein ARTHRO9V_90192 [Arthrobacter sp. 9V]|uniref:hypothetical protein n=1 Tax=Arthrobacter sp. 9V TaxID=2653132 RepID=UPI0012F22B5C|nr:hypothetical protein [Arthrobacter sp. 9V]VXC66808.1 hypothetical protein ARTHRO9V_90192 [Arthrobacter sp. 9V]